MFSFESIDIKVIFKKIANCNDFIGLILLFLRLKIERLLCKTSPSTEDIDSLPKLHLQQKI